MKHSTRGLGRISNRAIPDSGTALITGPGKSTGNQRTLRFSKLTMLRSANATNATHSHT